MKTNRLGKDSRRVLGRVTAEDFVGRKDELTKLVAHANGSSEKRALLLLLAPSAGVSELLRQAYDELFNSRENIVPIYFAFSRNDSTAVSKAIEFLNTFLRQYIAYRRNEPDICNASLPLDELTAQLVPAGDLEWIKPLVEAFNRLRFAEDDRQLIRFCLSAPQRVPLRSGRPFVMIEGVQLAETAAPNENLTNEILSLFTNSTLRFAFAGLRRHLLSAVREAESNFESIEILRLEKLADEDASRLVKQSARRQQVSLNDETAELLVQQFDSSPFFLTSLLQAARDKGVSLESYRHSEKLYVDELMGGSIQHYFASLLEEIAYQPETRQALIRFLGAELVSDMPKVPLENFRRRLDVSVEEIERILKGLHIQEFVNWDGSFVEVAKGPSVWRDYLKVRYRLDVGAEPRALVVADTISDALKRAPLTMERHHRAAPTLGLRDLLDKFDCQRVPASLFHFGKFSRSYKGVSDAEMTSGLEAETESIKLPRVVHVASCIAFAPEMRQVCDEERCMVARAFEGVTFSDENEVVWLAVDVDSQPEVDSKLTEAWCARLEKFGRQLGFPRIRIWLIANEGFSEQAMQLLDARGAYSSNRRQVEILTTRINETSSTRVQQESVNEYVMILPMDEDNELVAANAVEQVARRLNFRPEAINQIKTAIVEACINAAEHSFSPDRKIYLRFRVESDRLVITISSRGVVPVKVMAHDAAKVGAFDSGTDSAENKRGRGLDLIRTLMDEVEFECVDDGTSLRMTKYLRK